MSALGFESDLDRFKLSHWFSSTGKPSAKLAAGWFALLNAVPNKGAFSVLPKKYLEMIYLRLQQTLVFSGARPDL